MRIFRLLASHPIFLFKLNKSGFDECYQSAIKWRIWKSKPQCLCGFAGPHIHFLLIPTRSPETNTKQISYGDLFCGIVSVLVIQELWCIIIPVVMWLSRVIDWRKTKLYWYYSAVLFKLQYTFKKYTHYYTKACDVDFLLRETPNAPEQLKQYWKISLPPTLTK